jgi:hypothetical protein
VESIPFFFSFLSFFGGGSFGLLICVPYLQCGTKIGRRRALLEQRRSLPIASGTKELFSLFDALLVF